MYDYTCLRLQRINKQSRINAKCECITNSVYYQYRV